MSETTTPTTPTLKTHVALNTARFDESVEFYRAFFGADPVKHKPGYAKFDLDQPGLNFTLNQVAEPPGRGELNHLGIQVASTEEVIDASTRLVKAGLATREEMGADCCYALQDKVWVQDPDGHGWEVFVVQVDDTAPEVEAGGGDDAEACCQPSPQPKADSAQPATA